MILSKLHALSALINQLLTPTNGKSDIFIDKTEEYGGNLIGF